MAESVRIIGIDPGSVTTGWGVIDSDGRSSHHVAHGAIATGSGSLPERLGVIQREVAAVILEHRPAEMGIEEVFVARNAMSALKLGQARGAAICAGVAADLPVGEYPARLVKQTLVGVGGAGKEQVQHMVKVLLGLSGKLQADAADALGIALCHAHARTRPAPVLSAARRRKSVRWK
ncbi:MAG: crossover junction endodeoxyribonuclease RuvC [Halofilum sp. (in: g-proteobacteria)]|nr:crossover junction endodeoxyribonuclease RuvC [Halofilum sp. (in: g-proteobacteria)]